MTTEGPAAHRPDEFQRVAEFRAALRKFQRRTEQIARQANLTPQRYLLLLMIKGAPGGRETSTVTELADRMQLAQSSVTELVARAEEAGLITRQGSTGDARISHLRLTDEGDRRLQEAFLDLAAERDHLFASLEATIGRR